MKHDEFVRENAPKAVVPDAKTAAASRIYCPLM